MPSIIPKSAKNAVLGSKMGHFLPKNESGVAKTVLRYYKSIEMPLSISKSAKNGVFGDKYGSFWAPKCVGSVRNSFYPRQTLELM